MSINGIGTAAYSIERYPAGKAEKSAEFGTAGFMDIAAEKAAQDFFGQYVRHIGGTGRGILRSCHLL
jgi:hypothetical protein